MLITILVIAAVWILLSAGILVSVCMMSSIANQTQFTERERLPRREEPAEELPSQEAPSTAKNLTW